MWFNYKKALGYAAATAGLTAVCVATGAAVVTPAAIIATTLVVGGELAAAVGLYKGGKALFGFGKDMYEEHVDRDYRFTEEEDSEDEYSEDEKVDNKWKKDLVTHDGQYDEFHDYGYTTQKTFLGFPYGAKTEVRAQVLVPEENRWTQEDLDACQKGHTRSGRRFNQYQ